MVVSICCSVLGDGVSAANAYGSDTRRVMIQKIAMRAKLPIFVRACTVTMDSFFEVRKTGRKPDGQPAWAGYNEITQPVISVFDRSNNF